MTPPLLSFTRFLLLSLVLIVAGGCSRFSPTAGWVAPSPERANVYRMTPTLPSPIRRVAILPISVDNGEWAAAKGRDELQPLVRAELSRLGVVDVVEISGDQLGLWTGKRSWRPEEALPADFFDKLREEADCDGVLFSHLGVYKPYKPMVLGWSLKMVEAYSGSILWAVEEVFDGNEPAVARAAVHYGRPWDNGAGGLGEADSVLLSPKRFAEFTLASLFETLPSR